MTEAYKKLIATLEEIFQLDQADLDFGIYRIMNQKRDEINDFLKNRLLTQVNETLSKAGNTDGEALKKELENLETTLRNAGVDPETNAKVNELRVLYASTGSPEALTNEVFSHLTSFFRRYYNQGDFISQRRYKKDVYAIPYEGEEVKLHWANHDQYYIKTGENFKNYTFKTEGGKTVHFALREANTEQNNNKAQQGKERRFKLAEQDIFTEKGTDLTIWFTYEPTDKKEKQDELNKAALQTITANLPEAFKTGLLQNKGTKSNPGRTLLEKHLNDYTARNTFDYFIHKDLGGFLKRELDFYIKNEILQIDDINLDDPQSFDRQLKVIKALKTVAGKIIALLAQLEDFQKRLWLKKKFVMQSDYCITLDRVPVSLYPDIIANTPQIEEWKRLFAIDEIKADTVTLPYAEPLTIDFLKGNPFLVLDTAFFGREWKYKLLASIENIDEQCDGLLINSENFQALTLLTNRYNEQIKCTYIDPPYNTNASKILYKNNYEHSSWLSLMNDRIFQGKTFMKSDGSLACAIDDFEGQKLSLLLDQVLGFENRLGNVTLTQNPGGRHDDTFIATTHEYLYFYGLDSKYTETNLLPLEAVNIKSFKNFDDNGSFRTREFRRSGSNSTRELRPFMYYPIFINPKSLEILIPSKEEVLGIYSKNTNSFNDDYVENLIKQKESSGLISLLPVDQKGILRVWRWAASSATNRISELLCECKNGEYILKTKDWLENKEGLKPKSTWKDSKYASALGTNLLTNLFGVSGTFSYPKALDSVKDSIIIQSDEDSITLDYFAGSGTTGHAVINLNREDGGTRKYILVEMGEYFNTVTKPRIQKVIYSEAWKDGKPLGRKGSSHCFKYIRLESYEDTLNNLQLQRSQTQQSLLADPDFGEEYLLHYMLNVESRESLLNLEIFKRPFGYTLKVTENNELQPQEVDLVETFNYLIGLVVESTQLIRDNVVIEGRNLQGDKILVIWRDVDQTDSAALNEFFKKLNINTKDSEFKRIYVNGDNNLENLRTDGEQWKVVLIEEEFHKRMFDVKDV
ncbi:MAG: site-specific DNA-methyltransferase, partial [Lentimicrobium sp.]|nr:site-specific DNA-methyltransferase [Lentimicrobium sp.]